MDWPGYGIVERMYGQDARGANDGDGNGSQTRAPGGSKLGVTTKAMILTCQSYHMSPAIHPQSTPPTLAWQRKRDDKARCPVRPDTRGYAALSCSSYTYMYTSKYASSLCSPRWAPDFSAFLRVCIKPHYPMARPGTIQVGRRAHGVMAADPLSASPCTMLHPSVLHV